MTIYAHVSTANEIADQNGYYLELIREIKDAFGVVTPDRVTIFRYFVAGNMFMRAEKTLADKQLSWCASYMPDEDHAHQMLSEHVAIDSELGTDGSRSVYKVTELTVSLTEKDLIAISEKHRKGVPARNRVIHWVENHLGKPVITGAGFDSHVEMEGGSDY